MKLTFLAAIAILLGVAAAQAGQGSATVVHVTGAARYSLGDNKWLPLHEGDVLKPGAVIQTASESTCDIVLGQADQPIAAPQAVIRRFSYGAAGEVQQNIIRLRENTVLGIDKLITEQTGADTVTDNELDLRAGSVFGNVKKLSAASKFEIKLPNGVAGIRGTAFNLSCSGTLTVFSGSVIISYYPGNDTSLTPVTIEVVAGQQLNLNNLGAKPITLTNTQIQEDLSELGRTSTTTETYTTRDNTVITVSPTN